MRLGFCSQDGLLMQAVADYLLELGEVQQSVVFRRGERMLREIGQGKRYDGIVLDSLMRDMDALEFLLRLREMPRSTRPPVILLGTTDEFARIQCRAPGDVDAFLCKPLHPELLAERIHFFCGESTQSISPARQLLRKWGMREEETQSQYFVAAVQMLAKANGQVALRKELLPMVARRYGVSAAAVDSGLRRMIQGLEENQPAAYVQFKQENGLGDTKPTVKKLLYACSRTQEKQEEKETVYAGAQ